MSFFTPPSPQRWSHLVGSVQDLPGYTQVVSSLFEDGRVNLGRVLVLKQFTEDVCAQTIHAEAIRHHYDTVVCPTLNEVLHTPITTPSNTPLVVVSVLTAVTCLIGAWTLANSC